MACHKDDIHCYSHLGYDESPFGVLCHHVFLLRSEWCLDEAWVEALDVSHVCCLVHVAIGGKEPVLPDLGVVL